MKILITGFDPFAGESVNPSYEIVKCLGDIDGVELIKLEFPTVFEKAANIIFEKIEEIKPDAVISIGQAGGRTAITPELVGINLRNAGIEDNEGNKPKFEKISEYGDDGLFSTLNVREIVENIKAAGIPAELSYSAGTFVCNDVLYSVLSYVKENNLDIIAGFIHVPFIPGQVVNKKNMPSMSLDNMKTGIEIAIKTISKEKS